MVNQPEHKLPIAIIVQALRKSFGQLKAVENVEFSVRKGEIYGFLGPNGAGKTTTINMLTGLARPDSGRISYFGVDYTADIKQAQHLMGIVSDESNLYPELTGRENLNFCASLYGMPGREREGRCSRLLESFGLLDAADRGFATYSKGMKRKLTIAAGIIHRPKILFLDEPTTGIDVASARQIRSLLSGLNSEGTTIFLTTHYIEEAERLCDRVAFIVEGKIVRVGEIDELMSSLDAGHVLEIVSNGDSDKLAADLAGEFQNISTEAVGTGRIRLYSGSKLDLALLFGFFERQGIEMTEARQVRPTLEDVFVRVTGLGINEINKGTMGRRRG